MIEKTIKVRVGKSPRLTIPIGNSGEVSVRAVIFDMSEFVSAFGDGSAVLLFQRKRDEDAYPCTTTQDGETVIWVPNATDTAYPGEGQLQLDWYVGETLAKSIIFATHIAVSLDPVSDPPDAYESWLAALTALAAETQANVTSASGYADAASASASASASSAAAAAKSAENAAESAEAAAMSASEAAASEANAEKYAELASEGAATKGFFYVEGRDDGHLWCVSTDNVETITLKDNGEGRLVAQYG